ncbi:MAG: hypothetical protein AB8G86_12375, partial [Saprospiraceae bacterium]
MINLYKSWLSKLIVVFLLGMTQQAFAQFDLNAPTGNGQSNYQWYKGTTAAATAIGGATTAAHTVNTAGVYFATYDDEVCNGATDYFVLVDDCSGNEQVNLNVADVGTISWSNGATGTAITVTATTTQMTYTPTVMSGDCNATLPSFTVVNLQNCGGCADPNLYADDCDFDGDGVLNVDDLDDDNDGVLDSEECQNLVAPSTFTVAPGVTKTFTMFAANSFTFDLYYVDNSFNLEINGTKLAPTEMQFHDGTFDAGHSMMGFEADNGFYGAGGVIDIFFMNKAASSYTWDGVENPLVRVSIDNSGAVTLMGKRTESSSFEPLTVINGDPLNSVTWNANSSNTVIVSQLVAGPTTLSGYGYGVVDCLDTDNDGIANHLDLDSDGDGCSDAFEAGATTDLTADYEFTGTVGTNGLDNSLEGADDGIINYTSTYSYAIDPTLLTCTDTDMDGVVDIFDIDDDNDGILDVTEGSCAVQTVYSLDETATVAGATFGASGGSYDLIYTLTSGTAIPDIGASFTVPVTVSALNNTANGAANNWASINGSSSGVINMEPDVASLLAGLPTNNTTSENINTGSTHPNGLFRLLENGSIDNLGTFSISIGALPATTSDAVLTSDFIKLSSVRAATGTSGGNWRSAQQARLITLDSAASAATPYNVAFDDTHAFTYTAFSDGHGSYTVALLQISQSSVTFCTPADTDNDGIANHLDLDSDGDGCSDAFEAGATTDQTANFQFSDVAASDANGVSPSLDPSDDGNLNYTPTYAAATDDQTNACAPSCNDPNLYADACDFDGDGVLNVDDLDDDNDGILDTEEGFERKQFLNRDDPNTTTCEGATLVNTTVNFQSDYISDDDADKGKTQTWAFTTPVTDIGFGVRSLQSDGATYGDFSVVFEDGTTASNINFDIVDVSNYRTEETSFIGGGNNQALAIEKTTTGTGKFAFHSLSSGVTTEQGAGVIAFNFSKRVTSLSITNLTVSTPGNFVSTVFEIFGKIDCDTDNDGIANHLDLDSDGDGCSDAFEAGTITTEVADITVAPFAGTAVGANGFEDALETSEDGVYTGTYAYSVATNAAQNQCEDNDEDGVPDFADSDSDNDGILDNVECTESGTITFRRAASTSEVDVTNTNFTNNQTEYNYVGFAGGEISGSSLNIAKADIPATLAAAKASGRYVAFSYSTPAVLLGDAQMAHLAVLENFNGLEAKATVEVSTDAFVSETTVLGSTIMGDNAAGQVFDTLTTNAQLLAANTTYTFRVYFYEVQDPASTETFIYSHTRLYLTGCEDTDNDGIPNYLDLDSDGDGCSDAVEAGTITTEVADITVAPFAGTAVGANGFADGLETNDDGVYTDTYTYSVATNFTQNQCEDTDGDNVPNYVDLDDDGDGILDAVENPLFCVTTDENFALVTSGNVPPSAFDNSPWEPTHTSNVFVYGSGGGIVLGASASNTEIDGIRQTFPTIAGNQYQVNLTYTTKAPVPTICRLEVFDETNASVVSDLTTNSNGSLSSDLASGQPMVFIGNGNDFTVEFVITNGGSVRIHSIEVCSSGRDTDGDGIF